VIGRIRGLIVAFALLATGAIGGCAPADGGEVTVFAAASLRDVLERAIPAWTADRLSVRFVVSTDSSAALRAQIEQGAPADLFLSADTANPARLADAGLADGEPVPFAAAALAIVVPGDNPADLRSPADLARDGVRIIAAGPDVPITAYADRLVAALTRVDGYPADFVARYEGNVRSREDNVRAVLAKVELGEGDAAIVYAPDARSSDRLASVPIPAGVRVAAAYAGVVVRDAVAADAARAFLAWLAGPDGAAILADLGFSPAGSGVP
jgi:molybdate transport system substrate-binding protein